MRVKTALQHRPPSSGKRAGFSAVLAASALLLSACTLEKPQTLPTTAQTYMAATANPMASGVAAQILAKGGSAVDAAIAGQMMLAVVEPQASGLGGGSAVMFWDRNTGGLSFYDGLASAPASVPSDYTRDASGARIPAAALERSGRVVAVPGTLRTLALLHQRHGKLPWAELFTQAIATARDGFPMPGYLHLVLTERPDLAHLPAFAGYFDADGHPLPKGTRLHNPALAETLSRIAQGGAEYFYAPDSAGRIAQAVAQAPYPGQITAADLAAYKVREREPLCIHAFGRRICSAAPPVAGGLAVLQQLAFLDRMQIGRYPPGSVQAAHLLLEASRLAEADRRKYAADPDFVPVATSYLLSPGYLDSRARQIDTHAAADQVSPGALPAKLAALPASDAMTVPATTHLSIRDGFGNALSFTTTINLNFGSDIVVDGMVLNDAITNFATRPVVDGVRVANAIAPGKRPITTMAPTIVFGADDTPEVIIGAGGGARIIDSVVQSLVGYLAWGQNIRMAIEQPRIGAQNRAEELEHGTSAAALAPALRAMGHHPKIAVMNAAVQGITLGPAGLQGWGDPHRDGMAVGR
ncbi:gamma-glutamyltransferase family protein [Gluconacetobacter azotocaptans]|uniref:gamma-glutamyltransferase family protein n=1 Tax=Gluconacetobacter azotocaptans TaxID=142834 RepID=UPI00195880F4|nr:gamma-glutamyltransferase family protein [Gluconacetobacter azotocaptans]MBM9400190.1 gamma-glutamyltransferase family protein [Gluconacetobacter azotocaptans]